MLPVETARCVDCYTVLFRDEMDQCSAGHYICPGCLCDCDVAAQALLYAQAPELYETALRNWGAEGHAAINASPAALEATRQYSVDL